MKSPLKSQPGPVYAFISPAGLLQLLEYKYVSGTYSIGDKFMQPFWEWFVTLMPMTLAPNMITLIGLVGNLITLGIFLLYDTTWTAELPIWLYILMAATVFLYQTLDAIDGK